MKYHLDGRIAAYDKEHKRYFICQETQNSIEGDSYYHSGSAEENRLYYFETFAALREQSFDRAIVNIRFLLDKQKIEVLDVGCLYGLFLHKVVEQGWEGRGIEPSRNEAEFARNMFNLRVFETTFEDFISDEKWDVIAFWDVFEHLGDPLSVLDKAKSMLKDDGILIIKVPNANGLIHRLAFFIYAASCGLINFPLIKLFENHSYIYTQYALKAIFSAMGFESLLSYGENMIAADVDTIRKKSYMGKLPVLPQYMLSCLLVIFLKISSILLLHDSLVVYFRKER